MKNILIKSCQSVLKKSASGGALLLHRGRVSWDIAASRLASLGFGTRKSVARDAFLVSSVFDPLREGQARQGACSQLEVNRGLPAPLLLKYFTKVETKWVLKDEIKKMVEFRQMNLFKPWPILPMFDVVFIRNVMTYFDIETKKTILKRIRQCLQPQGCLFLGTAETTLNIDPEWQLATLGRATIYHNKPVLAVAA